jgi:hypothetical protein
MRDVPSKCTCGFYINWQLNCGTFLYFIKLSLIVLGEKPPAGFIFRKPGAIHKDRWMAVAIYGLKMYLYQDQLGYPAEYCMQLQRFVQFCTLLYVPSWMTCSIAADAPVNDLALIKALTKYKEQEDQDVGTASLCVLSRHTWYFTPELMPLALLSSKLPAQSKAATGCALAAIQPQELALGKPQLPQVPGSVSEALKMTLASLASPRSLTIFQLLKISDVSWLRSPPSQWNNNNDYQKFKAFVDNLLVTNDCAERGVALTTNYIKAVTKDERQRQHLFQIVEQHRRQVPNVKKTTII